MAACVAQDVESNFLRLRMQQGLLADVHAQEVHNAREALVNADQERQLATKSENAMLLAQQEAARREADAANARRIRE